MSLEKLKELEDAKSEANRIGEQLSNLIFKRKAEFFAQARKEFESYFKENGFTVNTTDAQFNATYGGINIQVTLPGVNVSYVGAYSVWDLNYNGKQYAIPLNELGSYPRVTSTTYAAPKTEDERIQKEINEAKQRSDDTKKKIEGFSNVKWGYGLKLKQTPNLNNKNYPQFESFKDLLQELFK